MVSTWFDASYPPSVLHPPPPVVPLTGVTAGTPGAFTPPEAPIPANITGLRADPVVGNAGTATVGTAAWTVGQYVVLGNAAHVYWDGSGWFTGEAPAAVEEELPTTSSTEEATSE